jgi:hypothetical protein
MRTFKDTKGREWKVEIVVGSLKRVKSLAKIDLLDPKAKDESEIPLIVKLSTDPITICDVLYAVCKPQAESLGVSDEEFGESLGGDAILHGQRALLEELEDFFRKSGRTEMATVVSQAGKMITAAIAEATTRISSLDAESTARSIVGSTFGGLPGLSGSTLTSSPLAN